MVTTDEMASFVARFDVGIDATAMGHERRFVSVSIMSGLPLIADTKASNAF
jgi:hypothetical protein